MLVTYYRVKQRGFLSSGQYSAIYMYIRAFRGFLCLGQCSFIYIRLHSSGIEVKLVVPGSDQSPIFQRGAIFKISKSLV